MEQELKKFLKNYYLTSFFFSFVFAYAIYIVLFHVRGLSILQIALLTSWCSLITLLLEIPTGALADAWSRKKMLALAPLIKALCFVIWFFANGNFYLYIFGITFWATANALVSGTSESLLYDTLSFHNKKEDYEKVLGRKKFYFNIALAISIISGGFIANYNMDWAIIFSVIPLILSSFFAIRLKEAPKTGSTGETHYLDYIKIAFQEIKVNKILLYLFIYLFSISVLIELEVFDQLYYQLAGLPIYAFGIAGFIASLVNATSAFFSHKLKDKNNVFYLLPLLGAGLFIWSALFPNIWMIGILLLAYFVTHPLKILIESKIQHTIKSESRATITSASSLLVNLFGIAAAPIFGLISKVWNLQAVYLSAGIFLAVFAIWVFFVRNKILAR